ncbi:DUF418 domain-containing protein [Shewanella maritima]|uniref:DUF418 domain-containing protein n=1 Tax=Shewanella maritima TaxID=2520507 RepID=UPI003735EAB7
MQAVSQVNTEQAHKESVSNDVPSAMLTERLPNLDAIRGFALLGIFFLNIYFMGNSFYGYPPHQPQLVVDIFWEIFSNFFLEGRFISLFSMLFGIGIYIQFRRIKAQHIEPYPIIASRAKWLIIFGAVHSIFIFSGDILLTYGVCSFLVYHYREHTPKSLIKKALIMLTVSTVFIAVISMTLEDEPFYRGSELYQAQLEVWTGGYLGQLLMQLVMTGFMLLILPFSTLWYCSAMMLIGIALFQQGYLENGFRQKQLLGLLCLSLLLSSADSLLSFNESAVLVELSNVLMTLSAIPMAMIYLHIIVKVCKNNANILVPLQSVGRLALSLYILQSIVGIMCFRHVFPQWQSQFDRADYMLFALAFSLMQVLIAFLYLQFFKQGPLEYLLRHLINKKQA